jgi:hypothetical protein
LSGAWASEVLLFLSLRVVSGCCKDTEQYCPSWNPRRLLKRERETKRERLRVKEINAKRRQGCQAFILILVTLWTFAGPNNYTEHQ